jgi:glucosamine kinase
MQDCENIFAVDAGGTNCRMRLVYEGVSHNITLGSANVSSDFDQSLRTLRNGIDLLCEQAEIPLSQLWNVPAYLGIAGLIGERLENKMKSALPFTHAIFSDDQISATVGALGDAAGLILGIGTGSFFARQSQDNSLTRVGGWGFTLGDEASGAWLGKRMLGKVLETIDGTEISSELSRNIQEEFDNDPATILNFTRTSVPADYAVFAPRIIEAAKNQDALAEACVQEAVRYIQRILGHLDPDGILDLCPIGGLAQGYVAFLPEHCQRRVISPRGSALDGACRLATRLAKAL